MYSFCLGTWYFISFQMCFGKLSFTQREHHRQKLFHWTWSSIHNMDLSSCVMYYISYALMTTPWSRSKTTIMILRRYPPHSDPCPFCFKPLTAESLNQSVNRKNLSNQNNQYHQPVNHSNQSNQSKQATPYWRDWQTSICLDSFEPASLANQSHQTKSKHTINPSANESTNEISPKEATTQIKPTQANGANRITLPVRSISLYEIHNNKLSSYLSEQKISAIDRNFEKVL